MSILKIYEELDKLNERHRKVYSVNWSVHSIEDKEAKFSCFYRYGEVGRKGNGAKALQEVIDLTDKWGLNLTLFAQYKGNTPRKLVSYYAKFGFKLTGDNFGIYPVMKRVASSNRHYGATIWDKLSLPESVA